MRSMMDRLCLDARAYCYEAGQIRSRRLSQCALRPVRSRRRWWCAGLRSTMNSSVLVGRSAVIECAEAYAAR